jgi:hypothetical protein
MSNHTPGPWFANPECSFENRIPIVGGNTELLALTCHLHATGRDNVGMQAANAALIAAAPDLLAALVRAEKWIAVNVSICAEDVARSSNMDAAQTAAHIATFQNECSALRQVRAALAKAQGEKP